MLKIKIAETKTAKIKLSSALAEAVAAVLKKKHNIDCNNPYDGFTAEQLEKITSIELKNPSAGACKGLEFLPNLMGLHINNGYYQTHAIGELLSIDNDDLQTIYKCKKLTELTIRNQPKITQIFLDELPNLKDVDICENESLGAIEGVDELHHLNMLTCYGNERLCKFTNLHEAIKKNVPFLKLDVNLFPKAINYDPKTGKYDPEVIEKLNSHFDRAAGYGKDQWMQTFTRRIDPKNPWREKLIVINHVQMLNLHNKACQILDECVPPDASEFETIVAIERYLAENVTYDYESIENAHTNPKGAPYGANGAHNCIMLGACVCQGYSRGEQYILSLRGIASSAISCVAQKDKLHISDRKKQWTNTREIADARDTYADHSILRIDGYYQLYSDPCWNAAHWQHGDKSMPYSLLSKGEISETHMLLRFDQHVENFSLPHGIKERLTKSIQTNELFVKTRSAEVVAARAQLGQQGPALVRGMIPTGRKL